MAATPARNYSRSYLRHLDKCGEILGSHLNTVHNLYFYLRLMAEIRAAIEGGGWPPMRPSSTLCSARGWPRLEPDRRFPVVAAPRPRPPQPIRAGSCILPGFVLRHAPRRTGDNAMDFFINSAQAQAAGGRRRSRNHERADAAPGAAGGVLFPADPAAEQARQGAARNALKIAAGDEVATTGGILGKVTAVGEQFLTVEIANGVNVKLQKHQVAQLLPKGTVKSA